LVLVDLMTRSLAQEIAPSDTGKAAEAEPVETEDIETQADAEDSRVETTAEELESFEKIKAITQTSTLSQLPVNYRDVVSYFGVHVGRPHWWFVRLYLSAKRKSFVTRLPLEEVRTLAAGCEVQEVSAAIGGAASRVIISSIDDLDKLASLILRCYEAEATKHS
jgi:hypothetical protein